MKIYLQAFLCGLLILTPAFADEEPDADAKVEETQPASEASVHETLSTTTGSIDIGGATIDYTATAGRLTIKDETNEKPLSRMFFVAYTKDDADAGDRPVTFCFNGGPGSCAVWLHLGMLGPRRVALPEGPTTPRPPYELVDNEYSLLDVTDLVFIDPVSTGYSRPEDAKKKSDFHGYQEDLKSVGQFIHDYTTRYGRWGSPKFVLGESYGGLRAAGLCGHLRDRYRMELNGAVIVSGVIDFQTIAFQLNNDLPYVTFLPSYAATAWYHGDLSKAMQAKSVEEIFAEARRFARGPYATALLAGDELSSKKRQRIAARLSELTGLSVDYLLGSNLRVPMQQFGKELLRDRDLAVGRFDGRYTGVSRKQVSEYPDFDPSGAAVFGAFTGAMNQYLRDELKVEQEGVYEILTGKVHPWSYDGFKNRYVNAAETLREAMAANPWLKVFVAAGYYDLATPPAAIEHTISHLGLTPEHRKNVTFGYYEGGHMMYTNVSSLAKLREDLLPFYADAIGE